MFGHVWLSPGFDGQGRATRLRFWSCSTARAGEGREGGLWNPAQFGAPQLEPFGQWPSVSCGMVGVAHAKGPLPRSNPSWSASSFTSSDRNVKAQAWVYFQSLSLRELRGCAADQEKQSWALATAFFFYVELRKFLHSRDVQVVHRSGSNIFNRTKAAALPPLRPDTIPPPRTYHLRLA